MCLKWSNSDSVAELPVLAEVAAQCRAADGPVLECGSGVTTFVAAAYARHGCWSLENHDTYRRRVVDVLERAGLPSQVSYAPLIEHGDFEWYQVPDGLPDRFALVICDGPRAATRGGRAGLLPVMNRHLAGATVVLDDSQREGEQAAMRMWAERFQVSVVGEVGSATILQVPSQLR